MFVSIFDTFWSIWSGQIQIGSWRAHWKSAELIPLFRIHRFHTLILLLIVGKCEFTTGHILFARTNWSYNSYNLYICMWQNGPDIVRKENTNRGHFSRSGRCKKFQNYLIQSSNTVLFHMCLSISSISRVLKPQNCKIWKRLEKVSGISPESLPVFWK